MVKLGEKIFFFWYVACRQHSSIKGTLLRCPIFAISVPLKALEPLPLGKIAQVSMDGLKVNLKLFRFLKADLLENYEVQCVDLSTCGLHTVQNVYKEVGTWRPTIKSEHA